jgi:hypothetical protein
MKKISVDIYFRNLYLTVRGTYSKAFLETREEPAEEAFFEISMVLYNSVDVFHMLNDEAVRDIEKLALEQVEDSF